MAITPWLHYADHLLALICRSPPGSNMPVGDNSKRAGAAASGAIEVECAAGWRIHIQGIVDAHTLRTLLQELARS
jgi:hypothetical protein